MPLRHLEILPKLTTKKTKNRNQNQLDHKRSTSSKVRKREGPVIIKTLPRDTDPAIFILVRPVEHAVVTVPEIILQIIFLLPFTKNNPEKPTNTTNTSKPSTHETKEAPETPADELPPITLEDKAPTPTTLTILLKISKALVNKKRRKGVL